MVERLGEMRKGRREKIEKGSREKEKKESNKRELRRQFEEEGGPSKRKKETISHGQVTQRIHR